ncbi:hypothetical protein OPT61_g5362 [Boeremia exigua]|uniref:Uncharacterized protein n=1 Tax=Boeremia exigua TaxID=749465 RepID=A0ACC2IAW6_9PLEO|nr:hypothetical protein OPT61_g5362 [Boeremia exigua]
MQIPSDEGKYSKCEKNPRNEPFDRTDVPYHREQKHLDGAQSEDEQKGDAPCADSGWAAHHVAGIADTAQECPVMGQLTKPRALIM